jgi:SanA protein
VGLLLATSPITPDGEHNYNFDNRIKAAYELYKTRKIDFIIASGGDYTQTQKNGCDEPKAILDSLTSLGIPENRIILDYEGTRTLNSIAKAKSVYSLKSLTLISQKYHNERAMYLADEYGIYTIGYNAEPSPISGNRVKNFLRECLARVKMFMDIFTNNMPSIKNDSIYIPEEYELFWNGGFRLYFNSVKGHMESDMIVGNFTGNGIDTIYVDCNFDKSRLSKAERQKYGIGFAGGGNSDEYNICYAVSNNPVLPPVELFCPNGLVLEGDLDGDGKDEWGYLYEWTSSQWRYYRVYTFDTNSGTWKHLYYGDLLDTSEFMRASGKEVVEKGPRKGLIKINWEAHHRIVLDTIVQPTYTPITKDTW